jgi:integrase/recombinase XerD
MDFEHQICNEEKSPMQTTHPPSQEENSLAIVEGLQHLSAASPEVALSRPMADLVGATLRAAGRSEHTRRAYQMAISLFLEYLDLVRGPWLPEEAQGWRPFALASKEGRRTIWEYRCPAAVLRLVDAGVLDGFRSWREQEGDSTNAATTRLFAVRSFLRVAYRDGILTQEQANAMGIKPYRQRQKRDDKPVGRRLSKAEVKALRRSVDASTCKGRRDLAILDMMLFAGLRRDEVASLSLDCVRQDNGRWWLVLEGKGNKTRRIKMADALYTSLVDWLEAAGLSLGGAGPIFLSVNKADRIGDNPINASVVGRLVAEYGHAAGLAPFSGTNRLSPHDLRRTCARNAYDNGASLLLVQSMLGHSDPKTTAHYIGAYDRDEDTAVDYVHY